MLPKGWTRESVDYVVCDMHHRFKINNDKITKCTTCNTTGFYKNLLKTVIAITKLKWVIESSSRGSKYLINYDHECIIGARYGKFYDKSIKYNIEVKNKFPSMASFQPLLERELVAKLRLFFDDKPAILKNINMHQYSPDEDYDDFVEMSTDALKSFETYGYGINDLKLYDRWMIDAIK